MKKSNTTKSGAVSVSIDSDFVTKKIVSLLEKQLEAQLETMFGEIPMGFGPVKRGAIPYKQNSNRNKTYKTISWPDAICNVMLTNKTAAWDRNEIKNRCATCNLKTTKSDEANEVNFRNALSVLKNRGWVRMVQTGIWKLEPQGIDYARQQRKNG